MSTDHSHGSTRTVGGQPHDDTGHDAPSAGLAGRLAFAWAFVGIPLAYGVFETAKKAAALFAG